MIRRRAFIVLALTLSLACADALPPADAPANAPADASIAMRRVYDTWSSKIEEPRTEVVKSEARWVGLWPELSSSGAPPPAPAIDFTRETVLVAARGTQSTGCNLIQIESVARVKGEVVAKVVNINPGERCACIAALSHAVDVVAIPKTDERVRFEMGTRVNECP